MLDCASGGIMPVVSMFYGIIVYMYYLDNRQHHVPHVHAQYQGEEAVLELEAGSVLAGALPPGKLKLVQAWTRSIATSCWPTGSLPSVANPSSASIRCGEVCMNPRVASAKAVST